MNRNMHFHGKNSRWVFGVVAMVCVAMLLKIMPLPQGVARIMPQWMLMVTLFCVVVFPGKCGVAFAFMVGLQTDAVIGSVIGQHAFVFVLLSYFALKLRSPLQSFPMWQQMLFIGGLALLNLLIQQVMVFLMQNAPPLSDGWVSLFTTALIWPAVMSFSYRFQTKRTII